MKKRRLIKFLKNYKITYDIEEDYTNIYNACIDYMNNAQNFDLEYAFEDIITYDVAEDIAKNEIERGGLIRLYYFLGDANLNDNIFRINGYGNLTDFHIADLEDLIEDLIDRLGEETNE